MSARTIALASACAVAGFLSMKLCGAYRQPAGIGPPKTLSASATMRVSETIFRSPERSSSVITGSRLLIASIWPERIAATAPLPAPTPMIETSLGFSPALASTKLATTLVDEPGAVTPIFLPFRSATRLVVRHRLRVDAEHDLRRAPLQHEGAQALALGLHVDGVLEGAGDDVGAAADQRLQRLRAAGEIGDRDVQPLGLEVAAALGDRQRQVVQQVLAADRDRQLGLLEGLAAAEGGQAEDGRCRRARRGAGGGVAWHVSP